MDIDEENTKKLIEFGSDIAGTVGGTALSLLVGGVGGALAGAIAEPVMKEIVLEASDFYNRQLSARERKRVGASLSYALIKIVQYRSEGREPRNDGFFVTDPTKRSSGQEILEGVLQKCKNEAEEKKLKYISNIFANTAFMEDVSISGANWLLQQAQKFTYRQLCIISRIETAEVKKFSWGPEDGDPAFEMELQDIDPFILHDNSRDAIKYFNEIGERHPAKGLSRAGRFCYKVMSLDEIPEDELNQLRSHFSRN